MQAFRDIRGAYDLWGGGEIFIRGFSNLSSSLSSLLSLSVVSSTLVNFDQSTLYTRTNTVQLVCSIGLYWTETRSALELEFCINHSRIRTEAGLYHTCSISGRRPSYFLSVGQGLAVTSPLLLRFPFSFQQLSGDFPVFSFRSKRQDDVRAESQSAAGGSVTEGQSALWWESFHSSRRRDRAPQSPNCRNTPCSCECFRSAARWCLLQVCL